jgi:diphthamide biosynthesis protein 3
MPLYEEIEIEDMTYDPITHTYTYPCPCGDKFKIHLEDLWDGEDIADCQSCTLFISVIYEEENLPPLPKDEDDGDNDNDTKESVKEKNDSVVIDEKDDKKEADVVTDLASQVETLAV